MKSDDDSLLRFLSQPAPRPDGEELRHRHEEDHGTAGLDVRLTHDDLERLNLVLQAPAGGLIDEWPLRVGEYILTAASGNGTAQQQHMTITVADAERELREHLEKELEDRPDGELDAQAGGNEEGVSDAMANLNLDDSKGDELKLSPDDAKLSVRKQRQLQRQQTLQLGYHKELSYTNLRGTTILLKPHSHPENPYTNPSSGASHASGASGGERHSSSHHGRLHDLHVVDCSDAHIYLLQPFEHATIAACTGCTIVVGAVAGLLHVVDCERVTITSAARRVLVSNCSDVLHCIFTPSPPLLVGDNRSCQFAPYNTYYDGLREDLLSTGLAAALISATGSDIDCSSPVASPQLQCASNKWKVPVELAKLEIPQVLMAAGSGSPASVGTAGGTGGVNPAADDKMVGSLSGKSGDDTLQTPVLLPATEFHILFVPLESESARLRRLAQEEATRGGVGENHSQLSTEEDGGGDGGTRSGTAGGGSRLDSQYCRTLADVLQMSPFRLPTEYERRALVKADRMRSLQQAMEKDLTAEQKLSLEEELNRGFRDWLVTSGNLRQVLDLVHMERKGGV